MSERSGAVEHPAHYGGEGDPYEAIKVGDRIEVPNGEIEVVSEPLVSWTKRHRIYRLPIIRGVVALGESLKIGFKALGISANAQLTEDEKAEATTLADHLLARLAVDGPSAHMRLAALARAVASVAGEMEAA